jgi:hypothetical protein
MRQEIKAAFNALTEVISGSLFHFSKRGSGLKVLAVREKDYPE